MNTKQILAIAQEAIDRISHGASLDLRVRLAQATAPAVKASSVKISKKAQPYKPIVGAGPHIEPAGKFEPITKGSKQMIWRLTEANDCQCAGCQILRGYWTRGRSEVIMLKADAPKFDKAAVIAKLEMCACGHTPGAHEKDDLENLLKCTAFIDVLDTECACTHFHYDVDAEEQQAA
jgi:hypothetical protein